MKGNSLLAVGLLVVISAIVYGGSVVSNDTDKDLASPIDWSLLPTVLEYYDDTFAYLATDSATTTARAAAWGLPGCFVSAVRTTLTSDALLIDIQLRDGDTVGEYVYILRYVFDAESDYRMNIQLEPADGLVELGVKKNGGWGGYVALTSRFEVYANSVRVVIPVEAFVENVRLIDLASARVDLKLALPTTPAVIFAYPGSGTMPIEVADQFLTGTDEEDGQIPSLADFRELLGTNYPEPITPSDGFGPPALHVEGSRIVDVNGETVVLRGISPAQTFDYAGEDAYFLKRDLVMAKSWGANTVLIPIAPLHYLNTGSPEYIEKFVDDYVMWAGELDMYAIVHWKANGDPWMRGIGGYEQFVTTLVDSLQPVRELAARYSQCPWVLYQVWGETITRDWDSFSNAMDILVDDIREQSPDALIIVPGVYLATLLDPIIEKPIQRENIVYGSDVYPWVWKALSSMSHKATVSEIWDGVSWQVQARELIDAGYPLILPEWGFGDPAEPSHEHVGTADGFGTPLMEFCKELGISWIAYCWDRQWGVPMFRNDERTELFPFGSVVKQALEDTLEALPTAYAGPPPVFTVQPSEAADAGCHVSDLLGGEYADVPSAILRAEETTDCLFSHWEGPVDHPDSPWVSVDLPMETPAVAVFEPNLAAFFDSDTAPFVYELPVDYTPDEFWLERSRPIAESEHWSLPGHEVASVAMEISEDSLQIGWEFESSVLAESLFSYEVHFYSPDSSKTLFLSARPQDDFVSINIREGDEYRTISDATTFYDETEDCLRIAISELRIEGLSELVTLGSWKMEAYAVYQGPVAEYYALFKGITYENYAIFSEALTISDSEIAGQQDKVSPRGLIDSFGDGDLESVLGTEWRFGEWNSGQFTTPPGVKTGADGRSYLSLASNGLSVVGAMLDLDSLDFTPYEAITLVMESVERMKLTIEVLHEDATWPEGGQYAAYTGIEIVPGRSEYVLSLADFLVADDIASCDHCTTVFALEDVDLLVIYIEDGAGELRIYNVELQE